MVVILKAWFTEDKPPCNGTSFCMLASSIVMEIKILLIDQILDHFVHHPVHKCQFIVQLRMLHPLTQGAEFSRENGHSASQKFPAFYTKKKFHYWVYNSLPLNHTVSPLNPVGIFTSYLLKINFNIILKCIPKSPKWALLFGSLHVCTHYSSPPCMLHAVPISFSLLRSLS
jgi:hypothetical protein